MKLEIKKTKPKTNTAITQAYHSRCSSSKLSTRARMVETFQPASSKVKNENDAIRNRISYVNKQRISWPKIE